MSVWVGIRSFWNGGVFFKMGDFPLFGTDVPLTSQMVFWTCFNSSTECMMVNNDFL